MDTEMIERIKTAIADKIAPAIDIRAPYAKVMVSEAAIAVVKAMREPTENMLLSRPPFINKADGIEWWKFIIDDIVKP